MVVLKNEKIGMLLMLGKSKEKRRPFPQAFWFHPDPAAMDLDNALDKRQSNACTFTGGV